MKPVDPKYREERRRWLTDAMGRSQVFGQLGDQVERGVTVTVTDHTVRPRRLPLRKVASKAN